MSMYTRCSSCGTHFKVSVQQLQACSGQVRCGRCTTVFDAFATLSARLPGKHDEPPPLDQGERAAGWTPSALAADPAPVAAPPAARAPSERVSATARAGVPMTPGVSVAAQNAAFSMAATSDNLRMAAATPASLSKEPLTLPDNLFRQSYGKALPGVSWVWHLGVGALLALILIQLVFFFRAPLAASFPTLRGTLLTLCAPFSCEVPLPRYADALYIESSDLQVIDSRRPQEVLLTAVIRNRADRLQAYPTVELTLTDTMDHSIAKRVFEPREYLADAQREHDGFAAGAEVNIKLMLNTADLRASGYRLFLYFPN